jgi:hypothetical protein
MEVLRPFPNQDVGQRKLEIDPLPFEMIPNTGLTMAMKAGHLVMGGSFP